MVYVQVQVSNSAANLVKPFEPFYIKIKNGTLYVQDQASNRIITPIQAGVFSAYDFGRRTTLGIVQPVYVAIQNGVVYVQTTVVNAVVRTKTSVYGAYGRGKAMAIDYHNSARSAIEIALRPITRSASAVYATIEPYATKVGDAVISVRMRIGETTVHFKTKASELGGAFLGAFDPLTTRIQNGYVYITGTIGGFNSRIRVKVSDVVNLLRTKAHEQYAAILKAIDPAIQKTLTKYESLKLQISDLAADQRSRKTAASAAGGAAAGSVSGGAVGLFGGAGLGAAIGVVPAIFTFGLSIPIGAAIGGGAGLCVGAAAGGTVGLASGGAVSYGVQNRKEIAGAIGNAKDRALENAGACKDYVKDKAVSSTSSIKAKLGR